MFIVVTSLCGICGKMLMTEDDQLCAKHAEEYYRWMDVSPKTFRALEGRSNINLVQIGEPSVKRVLEEHTNAVARAYDVMRQQRELISESCALQRGCSDKSSDAFS